MNQDMIKQKPVDMQSSKLLFLDGFDG